MYNLEKRLEESVEWGRIFDAIPDLIFVMDTKNTIIRANKAFCNLLRMKPEEVLGRKCYELLHKLNKPWPGCPAEEVKIDRNTHVAEVDDPNAGIALLVTTSPLFDDNGDVAGMVHVAKDISGLKNTEKELKKKVESLECFQKITVDRELKMKELKARIIELESMLNIKGNT